MALWGSVTARSSPLPWKTPNTPQVGEARSPVLLDLKDPNQYNSRISRDKKGSRWNPHKCQALNRNWSGIRGSFQLPLSKGAWWWGTNALLIEVSSMAGKGPNWEIPSISWGPKGLRQQISALVAGLHHLGSFQKYWHPGSTLRNHALISLGGSLANRYF